MNLNMYSRRRRVLTGAAALVVGAFAFTACAGPAGDSSSEQPDSQGGWDDVDPISLSVGTVYGPESWQSKAVAEYTTAVEEASEGKITFEFFYGDTLLSAGELAGGLSDGVVDMAAYLPAYTAAEFPIDTWAGGLTTGADVIAPVAGALMGIAAVAEWGFETDPYMAEIEDAGITALVPRTLLVADFGILCKDEAVTLDQIAGKRIRVGSATATAEVEALGGVPTTVSGPETYSAFQQGVIDCSVTNVPDMQALSLIDVAKNYTFTGLTGWSHAVFGMNTAKWESLPEIAKDALWEASPLYLEKIAEQYIALTLQGVELPSITYATPAPDMQRAIDDFNKEWVDALPASAPATLTDPQGAVDLARDLQATWLDRVTGELGYSADITDWNEYLEVNGAGAPDLQAWTDAVTTNMYEGRRPA